MVGDSQQKQLGLGFVLSVIHQRSVHVFLRKLVLHHMVDPSVTDIPSWQVPNKTKPRSSFSYQQPATTILYLHMIHVISSTLK